MTTRQTTTSRATINSLPTPSFVKPSQPTSATTRQPKRATLNFPIILPQSNIDACSYSLSLGLVTPAESQHSSPVVKAAIPSPQDSSGFLTSLAAQERKVLELREELQKAEVELLGLKNQWARYEAHKKKHEVRHGKRMEVLSLTQTNRSVNVNSSPKKPSDSEDSKVVRCNGRRTQPRVFSGSKHTRTLSLLSPTSENQFPSRSSSVDGILRSTLPTNIEDKGSETMFSGQGERRETTVSEKTEKDLVAERPLQSPSRDTIVRTSKQVASDLKEGLWTFFEDIRQATVGEEGINGTESRGVRFPSKTGSEVTTTPKSKTRDQNHSKKKRSSMQASTSLSAETSGKNNEVSFWQEFGLDTPGEAHEKQDQSFEQVKGVQASPLVNVEEDWDTWDTPLSQTPLAHRATQMSEGVQSVSSVAAGATTNALSWPELKKFTPSKLTRTVSDLMKEWDSLNTVSPQSGEKTDDINECTKAKI